MNEAKKKKQSAFSIIKHLVFSFFFFFL